MLMLRLNEIVEGILRLNEFVEEMNQLLPRFMELNEERGNVSLVNMHEFFPGFPVIGELI